MAQLDKNFRPLLLLIVAVVLAVPFVLRQTPVSASAQEEANLVRTYAQQRWSFDIQNGLIRFSHGNHLGRDRWFRAYFGTGYGDCSNCHKLEFPEPDDGGEIDFVAEIREHGNDGSPYGIQEASCLTCHNNVTAPNDCAWPHMTCPMAF